MLPAPARVGLWMTLSAVGFAALVGIVRHLSAELDVFVISFWRNCFAVLVVLPWMLRVGRRGLATRRPGLFLTRALIMVASSTALFFSVVLMPIAEATALSFTAPLFATMLAVLVLHERVGARRWLGLLAGFAGVLVILRPGAAAFDPVALLVLFSALTFAGVVVSGKMLAASESPELIVVYLAIMSVPLSLLPALFVWEWPGLNALPWLLLLGLCANGNMYGIARAMRIGDASLAMPFDFIRLPATAAVGFLAFGEQPDGSTWLGAAIIFAASLYVSQREISAARRARPG